MSDKDLESIAKKYMAKAKKGDLKAIMDLIDRLDGKPRQESDVTHHGGVPVQVVDPGDFPEAVKDRMNGK